MAEQVEKLSVRQVYCTVRLNSKLTTAFQIWVVYQILVAAKSEPGLGLSLGYPAQLELAIRQTLLLVQWCSCCSRPL